MIFSEADTRDVHGWAADGPGAALRAWDFTRRDPGPETVRPAGVNGALDRLARGDVRYRFVLDLTA